MGNEKPVYCNHTNSAKNNLTETSGENSSKIFSDILIQNKLSKLSETRPAAAQCGDQYERFKLEEKIIGEASFLSGVLSARRNRENRRSTNPRAINLIKDLETYTGQNISSTQAQIKAVIKFLRSPRVFSADGNFDFKGLVDTYKKAGPISTTPSENQTRNEIQNLLVKLVKETRKENHYEEHNSPDGLRNLFNSIQNLFDNLNGLFDNNSSSPNHTDTTSHLSEYFIDKKEVLLKLLFELLMKLSKQTAPASKEQENVVRNFVQYLAENHGPINNNTINSLIDIFSEANPTCAVAICPPAPTEAPELHTGGIKPIKPFPPEHPPLTIEPVGNNPDLSITIIEQYSSTGT